MKKYTLILPVFLLAFILSGFNANSASAANCAPGDLFNTTNGQPCSDNNPQIGCLPGYLFSPVTGQPCNNILPPPVCRVIWYPNLTIGSRGENVRAFQQSLKDEGFLSGRVDGVYGPVTAGASVNYYRKCPKPIPNPNAPIISGVSGPQTLDVNQQGTWTVTAYDNSCPKISSEDHAMGSYYYCSNLSYSVDWKENEFSYPIMNSSAGLSTSQSATFTHSYSEARTYNPTFTVTNSSGLSAQASLSVNVGNTTSNSYITVISPNGGEVWAKGTTHAIKWQDNTPPPPICSTCLPPQRLYDIKLVQYQSPCSDVCPMYYPMPRTIVNGVYGSSYDWTIPNCTASNPCSSNFEIVAGLYTIQVCQTGSSICDSSDNYFQITNGTTTSTPAISYLSPSSGPVGTRVVIYGSGFTATGNKVKFGNLGNENNPRYSFNSSDGRTLVFSVPSSNYMSCWDSYPACYAPAYSTQPGVYAVSVINGNGTSNSVNFTVISQTSTSLTITTTSPLPSGQVGTSYSTAINANSGASWQINSGSLPPGLSFSTNTGYTNYITGTPTTTGTYNFTVSASAGDYFTSKQFTLNVVSY
jgi:hypothetical protein